MTPASFLAHHGIIENPFRAEEARQDIVLARIVGTPDVPPADPALLLRARHGDFDKIIGDLRRPSSCVVFGEKGSGKTAIRMQLTQGVASHNANWVFAKVLLVLYDDMNVFLERLHDRLRRRSRRGESDPAASLKQVRVHDHIDAVLMLAVPRLVDSLLEEGGAAGRAPDSIDPGPNARQSIRKLDPRLRRDLLLLQAVYDRPDHVAERTRRLRRLLNIRPTPWEWTVRLAALMGWVLPVGIAGMIYKRTAEAAAAGQAPGEGGYLNWRYWLGLTGDADPTRPYWTAALALSLLLWLAFLLKRAWIDRFIFNRLVGRVYRQVRVTGRSEASMARSLRRVPASWRRGTAAALPTSGNESARAGLLQRFREIVAPLGYAGVVIIVDRADEPGIVAGDVERMKSVTWPLLSNALLQQEGIALKLLLPIELRHLVFRESSAFFQRARMDKQGLVDELAWTGPMLYDLADTRIAACTEPGRQPVSLSELFAPDVTREMIVEALELMRNPRDASKLLYDCLTSACAAVTTAGAGEAAFRIPRAVLDRVKREQAERVRQLAMGIRPA